MRLLEVVEAAIDDSTDLPDTVNITPEAFDTYFGSWLRYLGTGRKFLPQAGGLNDQNEIEMQVIMLLDSMYGKILQQVQKETDDATETG